MFLGQDVPLLIDRIPRPNLEPPAPCRHAPSSYVCTGAAHEFASRKTETLDNARVRCGSPRSPMTRAGKYLARLVLCQLAVLSASAVARAEIVVARSAIDCAPPAIPALGDAGNRCPESLHRWVPYDSKFPEASRWLEALASPRAGQSVARDDSAVADPWSAAGGTLPAPQLFDASQILELVRRLTILSAAKGIGSPSDARTNGPTGPQIPASGCLPAPVRIPAGQVEWHIPSPTWVPFLFLASRLFRPPRAGDAKSV